LALALAANLALAAPAAAVGKRVEAVGVAPAPPPGTEVDEPLRRQAVANALEQAVLKEAGSLAGRPAGRELPPGDPIRKALAGDPSRYTVRYRVLEDLGERPALFLAGEAERELAVRVEVLVDSDRIAETLLAAGLMEEELPVRADGAVHLILEGPPSWKALQLLRAHLLANGATGITPEAFEAGRAVWAVAGPWSSEALRDLLTQQPPAGLEISDARADAVSLALWLREAPVPAGEPAPGD
jgi:hypothetical protein